MRASMNKAVKKFIAIIGLLLFCVSFMYASGGQQRSDVEDAEQNKIAQIEELPSLGPKTIRIMPTNKLDEYTYVFIVSDGKIRDPRSQEIVDNDDLENLISISTGMASVVVKSPSLKNGINALLHIEEGNVTLTEELLAALRAYRTDDGSMTYTYPTGTEPITETIMAISSDGEVQAFRIQFTPSFFVGEDTVLTFGVKDDDIEGLAELSDEEKYKIRGLAFFYKYLEDNGASVEELSAFEELVENENGNYDIQLYKEFKFEDADKKGEIYDRMRRAFHRHFQFRNETFKIDADTEINLPYMDLSSSTFNAIYGGKKQLYISAYLDFCFLNKATKPSKPILSYYYEKDLNENDLAYNYKNLESISADESESLAKAALRYLNWGVEHTQNRNDLASNKFMNIGISTNPVFDKSYNRIQSWIGDTGITSRDAADNYLSYDPLPAPGFREVDTPKKVHIIDGDYTGKNIRLVGSLKEDGENYKETSISRIEFLTARNYLWQDSLLDKIELSTNEGSTTEVTNNVIRDGNIQLEKEDNSLNFNIQRIESNPIELKFKFKKTLPISGLLLVRGKGYLGTDVTSTMKSSEFGPLNPDEDRLQIKAGEDIISASEIAIAYDDAMFYKYTDEKFGYVLSAGDHKYWDENGKQLSFIYYVFDDTVDTDEISFIDNTGTDYLNISEFMVFNENPVEHITQAMGATSVVKLSDVYNKISNNEKTKNTSTLAFDNELDITDYQKLTINGIPSNGITIDTSEQETKSVVYFDVQLAHTNKVKTVLVWETNPSISASETLAKEFGVKMDLPDNLIGSDFFTDADELALLNNVYSKGWYTTPFYNEEELDGDIVQIPVNGNPLPYSAKGIDSPRIFAYKMNEQYKAQEWIKSNAKSDVQKWTSRFSAGRTTLAEDIAGFSDYMQGYANEMDMFSSQGTELNFKDDGTLDEGKYQYTNYPSDVSEYQSVRPFLPGKVLNTKDGNITAGPSMYNPDKTAGVDSLGMLIGTIGMSDINGAIPNLSNVDIKSKIDVFFKMNSKQKGTDASGKPSYYYTSGDSYLDGDFRLTKSDIEHLSILVPNIFNARPGDLIVRFFDTHEPHIGIIVSTDWDDGSPMPDNIEDQMAGIKVVSITRGLEVAMMGTWGNKDGLFGGFTDEPTAYHIRRLMKLPTGTTMTAAGAAAGWELVKDVPVKYDYLYPTKNSIPRAFKSLSYYGTSQTPTTAELKAALDSLHGSTATVTANGFYKLMPPTQYKNYLMTYPIFKDKTTDGYIKINDYTGWRQYNNSQGGKNTTWHFGMDYGALGSDTNYFAPEDGAFWFYDSEGTSSIQIRLPWGNNELLNEAASYRDNTFGFITIFVTNPENPKAGRIYLFCHQGGKNNTVAESKASIETAFKSVYGQLATFPYASGVNKPNEMRKVKAGEWIGSMGNRYNFPKHLHLDVYEYFEEIPQDSTYHWQRINPYTIVKSSWVKEGTVAYESLKSDIQTNYGTDVANKYFRDLP